MYYFIDTSMRLNTIWTTSAHSYIYTHGGDITKYKIKKDKSYLVCSDVLGS